MTFDTGGGEMTAYVHRGSGKHYILSGSGRMYNAEAQNFGKD